MRFTLVHEQEPGARYVVTVSALPGGAAQGDDREESAADIRGHIEAYVEALKKAADPIPVDVGCETG